MKIDLMPSLALIRNRLVKRIALFNVLFFVVCIVIKEPLWIVSSIIGSFFSFLVLTQLMLSQSSILQTKKKQTAFIYYFFRLGIYIIPMVLALTLKNYLNFIVILVFLFSFQVHYVFLELFKNLKRYKRRKKQWTH